MDVQTTVILVSEVPTSVDQVPSVSAASPASNPALHRVNLKDFLYHLKGGFVSVDYVKCDGSKRTLVGRLEVRKHLKGGVNKTVALDRPYLTMYDVQNNGYRTVNLATVSKVRANHMDYVIVD